MSDFLKFFDEIVKNYPMHMEIYYSKTMNWNIDIYKNMEEKIDIVNVQDCDMELAFAKAHVELKEWLLENNGGKEMSKTIKIKDLELNAEVIFGGMTWIIRKKDKDANMVTLALKDSIRNMEFDEAEPENPDEWISHYGNNNYFLSNVRQWLNSDGKDWFRKTHEYDAAPSYVNKKGFMSRFRKKELKHIAPKQVPGSDDISDLFYLPAAEEKDLVTGEQFDRNWVWTSSPNSGYSCGARSVHTSGALSSSYACNGNIGVRPLCDLRSGTKIEKENGVWTIVVGKREKKNCYCGCRCGKERTD